MGKYLSGPAESRAIHFPHRQPSLIVRIQYTHTLNSRTFCEEDISSAFPREGTLYSTALCPFFTHPHEFPPIPPLPFTHNMSAVSMVPFRYCAPNYAPNRRSFVPVDGFTIVTISVSVRLSVCLSVCQSVCLCIYMSACLSCQWVCNSVCVSLSLRVCLPLHVCLSICLPVCLSTCLSACLPVCLTVCHKK